MKKIIFFFLLSNVAIFGQTTSISTDIYISRKGLYQIKYNSEKWHKNLEKTAWDIQFKDKYNLLTAYFMEFDSFIPENKLKTTIKGQFEGLGKIKDLKIYKKTINDLAGNYFEFEFIFKGYSYKYQGFIYNGKGGAIELQFGMQSEAVQQFQHLVDELCNNLTLYKTES